MGKSSKMGVGMFYNLMRDIVALMVLTQAGQGPTPYEINHGILGPHGNFKKQFSQFVLSGNARS